MVESVNALGLLKEEMQTEEIHLKVNAIHRLKTVILSIGPSEVQSGLIPYLQTLIEEQDDEVLFAIAEELGDCFEYASEKTVFLPLLEILASKDETVVREQATKSLTKTCQNLSNDEMQNLFCPLLIRLAGTEWFTGRVSSVPLFYHAYPRANSQKERLRKKFMELCQEDTPMIRRVCAAKLGEFSTQLEKQHVIQELLPIFRQLSQDDQDSCRVLCIESLIPMAGYLSKEENRVHTLGSLLNAGEDKSWKVRLCFAKNFAKFAEAFGRDITDNNLIQTFNLLLDDGEPEVKNAAVTSLAKSLTNLSTEKICNIILPTLQSTVSDAQVAFRAGVALALCEMAPLIGKNSCISTVIPILTELLKDDSSEVRLNVAGNMGKLASVVDDGLLTPALLKILENMTKDPQWRVRMGIFKLIGELSVVYGMEVFMKSISTIFMSYLVNSAASVRNMGVEKAGEMGKAFGSGWVIESFIPQVVESFNVEQQGFNYKMCAVESLAAIIPALDSAQIDQHIIPTFLKAADDKIPNVAFCLCRVVKTHKASFDAQTFAQKLAPKLRDLTQRGDKDVRYYATLALQNESSTPM